MVKRQSCSDLFQSDPNLMHEDKKCKSAMSSTNQKSNNGSGYPLSYPITTGNKFDGLLHGSLKNQTLGINNVTVNSNKNTLPKLPPIVTKLDSNTIRQTMKTLKIVKFQMKCTSIGLKVSVYHPTHYRIFTEELNKVNAEYFSYTLDENKTSRYVLFGLPSLPIEEVENYIKETGLKPSRITKILPKNSRSNNCVMYFASFPNTITLNHLKNHRVIGNIVCTWDIPHKKPERLTQCFNCFMYGHTKSNCNMKSKCQYCSLSHIEGQQCTIKDSITDLHCANCEGNHSANSVACPKRLEFLRIREEINQKNSKTSHNKFNWTSSNFPNLVNNSENIEQTTSPEVHTNQPSFADILQNNTTSFQPQQVDRQNNTKLYTSTELLLILDNVMDGLRRCRTPAEQVQIILATAIKYVCT